jgi:hypothetical protein
MRLAGRQWSLLLRRNGTTIVKLNTGALRRRFPNDVEAGGSAYSVANTGQSTLWSVIEPSSRTKEKS